MLQTCAISAYKISSLDVDEHFGMQLFKNCLAYAQTGGNLIVSKIAMRKLCVSKNVATWKHVQTYVTTDKILCLLICHPPRMIQSCLFQNYVLLLVSQQPRLPRSRSPCHDQNKDDATHSTRTKPFDPLITFPVLRMLTLCAGDADSRPGSLSGLLGVVGWFVRLC